MQSKYPQFLIDPEERVDPKDPTSPRKATRGGPLLLRWYNDAEYRRWEEAKALTSCWGLSQKLAQQVAHWFEAHGITSPLEFRAAGFRGALAARESFNAFLGGRRGGVEPQPLPKEERSTIELHAGKTLSVTPQKGNTPE